MVLNMSEYIYTLFYINMEISCSFIAGQPDKKIESLLD